MIALLQPAYAVQPQVLSGTFASNNGQAGNMFDLTASSSVVICSFDVNLDAGVWDLEIYTVAGSYAPVATSPSAWGAPLVQIPSVTSAGQNAPTSLGLGMGVAMSPGQTRGFYVTVTNGPAMNYTNATAGTLGNIAVQDSNLALRIGSGVAYPFGAQSAPRVWNGNVHYSLGVACPPTAYQRNQAPSTLAINGVQSSGATPAVLTACRLAPAVLTLESTVTPAPFEVAVTFGGLVPRGAPGSLATPSQTLNLNLSAGLLFVNGGVSLSFQPFPGSLAIPLETGNPISVSAQMVVVTATHPEGFAFSQGSHLNVVETGIVPGPTGNDTSVVVNTAAAPFCIGPIQFYGVSTTTLFVSSNGRVLTGAPSDDFSPSLVEALSGSPFVGAWTDLDPGFPGGGGIRIESQASPQRLDIIFDSVAPFGAPSGTGVSFRISYEPGSSAWILADLPGLVSTSNLVFLGMSLGSLGASNPGPTNFSLLGSGAPPTAGGMLYQFGQANLLPVLHGGVSELTFTPALVGGAASYTWSGS